VLLDLDPQGNATSGLGINKRRLTASMFDVLVEQKPLEAVLTASAVDFLAVAPANSDLVAAEYHLAKDTIGTKQLQRAVSKYLWNSTADRLPAYIVIDCPPSVGYLTINALLAADSVLIPVQAEYYALEGLAELFDSMTLLREQYNPKLALEGILLTMVDSRTTLARQVEEEIRSVYKGGVFSIKIRRSVRLSEAPSHGVPIILYDIRSNGAVDYLALAREIILNEKKSSRSWFIRPTLRPSGGDRGRDTVPGTVA
jgi:chromosome partitioning protein